MTRTYSGITLLMGVLFSLSACAQPQEQVPASSTPLTQATLAGQPLQLVEHEGQCVLRKPDNSDLKLEMNWPCQFTPDKQGKVQTEVHNSVPIVLVEHSQPNPAPDTDCVKTSQAVRLRDNTLETSRVNRSAMCHIGQQDQKMFTGLFRW